VLFKQLPAYVICKQLLGASSARYFLTTSAAGAHSGYFEFEDVVVAGQGSVTRTTFQASHELIEPEQGWIGDNKSLHYL